MPTGIYEHKPLSEEHKRHISESAKKNGFGKWMKGRKLSEETRRKLSIVRKGRKAPWAKGIPKGFKHSIETRRKISLSLIGSKRHLGCKHSEEAKKKMSLALKGKPAWNKGKPTSLEMKTKLSLAHLGIKPTQETLLKRSKAMKDRYRNGLVTVKGMTWKLSEEARRNHSLSSRKGEKAWNWKGGVTSVNKKIRNSLEFRLWRESVFARDNWTCRICKKRGGQDLHPHHIRPFALYPELRFSVDNGQTLCVSCHKKTDSYGVKKMYFEVGKGQS